MRFCAFAIAMGLGALAGGPCLALTVQAAPPRPDIAQHLRSSAAPASRVLPAADEVKDSFAASVRPRLGEGVAGPASYGTRRFGFGPLSATVTTAPGYGGAWNDAGPRDLGNPLSLTPPRR
jgi:hypothetical protein